MKQIYKIFIIPFNKYYCNEYRMIFGIHCNNKNSEKELFLYNILRFIIVSNNLERWNDSATSILNYKCICN